MRRKKRVVGSLLFIALLVVLVSRINLQSAEEYYGKEEPIGTEGITATIEIRCDTVLDHYDQLDKSLQSEEYVPADGTILAETSYEMTEGDTVFDLLLKAVKENKIQMEFQGAGENAYGSVYIQGIHHLYEFSCGPLSGWMYLVNDKIPDYGCSKYELKDGDRVAFLYTCELGKDLGRE